MAGNNKTIFCFIYWLARVTSEWFVLIHYYNYIKKTELHIKKEIALDFYYTQWPVSRPVIYAMHACQVFWLNLTKMNEWMKEMIHSFNSVKIFWLNQLTICSHGRFVLTIDFIGKILKKIVIDLKKNWFE